MFEQKTRNKISFQGIILSVQPRSNVWRYRLDNRTHRMTGYNLFLKGVADGVECKYAVAVSEIQQMRHCSGDGKQWYRVLVQVLPLSWRKDCHQVA